MHERLTLYNVRRTVGVFSALRGSHQCTGGQHYCCGNLFIENNTKRTVSGCPCSRNQSQKTQGFCVADFATLSDETRSHSKIFPLFIWIKEPCVRKLEGFERSKLLGISQTKIFNLL